MKIFPLVSATALVGLAACATPQYPATANYVAPAPVTPQYPVGPAAAPAASEAASAPSAPAAAIADDPPPPPAEPSSAPVTTTPLPPASAASPPPAAPEAATPPPGRRESAIAPPPVRQVPPPPKVEVRYLVDGRVITPKGMYRDYEVRRGDHIDAIARDLQTTRRELIDANDLEAPYRVRPGRHLKIPVAKAYEARSGDTMAGVARRFGVNLNELASLNDLPERGRLSNGMLIALPARYEDHGPVRETQEVYATASPRPRATYRTEAPAEPYAAGPYVPSEYALAAAAARRAQMANNTYSPPAARYPLPGRLPEGGATQATIVSSGQGRFLWPVRGEIITGFGATGVGRRNDGLDIRSPAGTEVRAAAAGEVVYAGNQVPGFGNLVLIKHADGWVSAYAHLADVSVHMRQSVYQGQQVGSVGLTGGVSEPQLHFEIRYAPTPADKAKPLDPLLVLPKDATMHAAAGRPG